MSSFDSKTGIKKGVPPAADGTKPSPYSRFIPREELNSFSAWSPDHLGGTEPVRGVHRQPTQAEPPPGKASTSAEDTAQAVHGARQQGYQDGYRDGMAALESFKQSHASQMSAQIGVLLESLSGQLEDLQQDMARAMAVSATHLARQMVRSELEARPDLVAQVAAEALEALLLSARHITLRVHPDDLQLVTLGAAQMLSARGARVISDTSLTRGGCMVESDIGVIDASVETRWRRAVAAIGCDEHWSAAPAPGGPAAPTDAFDEPPQDNAP
ncbi:MAG: FliH/SctL family protein [Pseudomonadota bacterium]